MQYPVNDHPLVMTSIEIAELVEKRHDNVKRTIESLIERGTIASPQIEEKPTAGRPVSFYVFEGEQGKR
ncbi:phage regulatory protein/antirepressor Ant, partial [Cronobacter sakazakii]|nr:phage regulatory protein/antirepressor Ant [Cronobacter sakazakii]EGT5751182.1 phage regulatory protein/antirepressor Ant [Cronobacter sakazakii]